MISFFILTVFASLCGSTYFNIIYATILLSQLLFFKDSMLSNIGRILYSNFFETFASVMEMKKYMTTERCKNF